MPMAKIIRIGQSEFHMGKAVKKEIMEFSKIFCFVKANIFWDERNSHIFFFYIFSVMVF